MPIKPWRSDLGWCWQIFSGRQMLVTDGGGAQVVLAAAHHSMLQTRDLETGTLRNLDAGDQIARIIAAAPDARRHAQTLIHGIDLGMIRIESTDGGECASLGAIINDLRAALAKSGAV